MDTAKRPLVAVVDDDPSVSGLLQRLLSRAGYEAEVAEDKAHAVKLAAGRRPALVLVDVSLPDANGWDLVPHIWPGVPFLIITGAMVDDESRRDARLLGAKGILQKPFTPDQILDAVRVALA